MKNLLKVVYLLSFFYPLFSANAQAPEKMSYQAVIRNTAGVLVSNQAIGMRVTILQGSATGTEVYKELFNPNPQTNANGLVTIEIGTGVPLTGTFATINWGSGPFFVKTETDPTGGTSYTIAGTSQLMSVPYALYAKTSGNAGWGLSGNAGTNPSSNYIGTQDNNDVIFRRFTTLSGRIGATNTGFGRNSLLNIITNPSAFYNTGYGAGSLQSNIGSLNTAVGYESLFQNSSGTQNTASGVSSLYSNTTGENNVAFGFGSSFNNMSGNENTAVGALALQANTTSGNTAVGCKSLKSNTVGNGNTANGFLALEFNTIGSENTAIGSFSMRNNTTGVASTSVGSASLSNNTVGLQNTAIGAYALYLNSAGNYSTAIGYNALLNNTTGSNNTSIGYESLFTNTTGSNNTAIGNTALVPSATASNQVRIGNTAITYAGTQVAWSVTSDSRWKENIQPSNLGLNFIKDLKPVFYTRKNDETKKVEYGIIAQELEASLLKNGANTNGIITKDDEGMYSVRYNDLLAPMIKAIQEQQVLIESLKSEIQTLKSKQ
jgi:trimeric autotransporter adhesin